MKQANDKVADTVGATVKNVSDMQKKMDHWGLKGCEARRDDLVAHLMSQSDKLIPAFRIASGAVPEAVKKVLATRLLNKAMRNAKKELER